MLSDGVATVRQTLGRGFERKCLFSPVTDPPVLEACSELRFLLALFRELPQREPLTMGQRQADRNNRNEADKPEHDPATRREFLRHLEEMLEYRYRSQLRASAHARQLHHGANHA